MFLSNVRSDRTDRGFTLLEITIVVVLAGIIGAIAAPSFLSAYNRTKLDNALNDIRGALQEAQREAMRQGKSCSVIINGTTGTIRGSCLITGNRKVDSTISITPSTVTTIPFSFRGNTTSGTDFILSYADNPNSQEKRCLSISSGLGILRTGVYDNSTSTCKASL